MFWRWMPQLRSVSSREFEVTWFQPHIRPWQDEWRGAWRTLSRLSDLVYKITYLECPQKLTSPTNPLHCLTQVSNDCTVLYFSIIGERLKSGSESVEKKLHATQFGFCYLGIIMLERCQASLAGSHRDTFSRTYIFLSHRHEANVLEKTAAIKAGEVFRTVLKLCSDSKLAVCRWRSAGCRCIVVCWLLCALHGGDCAHWPLMHLIVHYLSAEAPMIIRQALHWLAACYVRLVTVSCCGGNGGDLHELLLPAVAHPKGPVNNH